MMFTAVDKAVFYFLAGKEFYDSILHGDFIKIVVED